jgi:NifU-like protein involved in Fe-S cluster formation
MEFWIRVRDERLVAIGFTTDGCGTSRAAGSMATELALGKTIEKAQEVDEFDVNDALDGLPAASRHCALLATDTLLAAIADALSAQGDGV